MTARLIGVREVRQREGEGMWKRNDRFFAVATHAPAHAHLHTLADLRPRLLDEIESFFIHYAGFNGKTLEGLDRQGADRAGQLLEAGAELLERTR